MGQTSVIYHFDVVLAKDPWHSSCCRSMGSHLSSSWEQPASFFSPYYYMGTLRLQHNELQVSVFLSAEFSFIRSLSRFITKNYEQHYGNTGYAVTQLVRALRYKRWGPGFNSRWGFEIFYLFSVSGCIMALGSTWWMCLWHRADNLTTFVCWLSENPVSLHLLRWILACTGTT